MKVLGGGDEISPPSLLTPSFAVDRPTPEPLILRGACALDLTCKRPERQDFDLVPLVSKLEGLLPPRLFCTFNSEGKGVMERKEVAAVATMVKNLEKLLTVDQILPQSF